MFCRSHSWRGSLLCAGALGVLAAALACPVAAQRRPPPDPETLLRSSESAETRVDYSGVKSLRSNFGRRPEQEERKVKVYHRAPDQTRTEFLSGGPVGSVLIQRGDRHYWLEPGNRVRRVPPRNPPGRMDLLLENYRVRKLGFEKIAGRGAVMLAIEPKYPGNPKKHVWIDPRSGLTLKSQVFSSSGELREESAFVEIDCHPTLSDSQFEVPTGAPPLEPPRPVQLDFAPRRPRHLPPGYLLVSTSTMLDRRGRVVHHMRYTDGLNTLSLFEARATPNPDGPLMRDARQSGIIGDIRYSIAGDTSPEELRKMAESL